MTNCCVDCGKKITKNAKRCHSCHAKLRWSTSASRDAWKASMQGRKKRSGYQKLCMDCGVDISGVATRCHRCAMFFRIARGDYTEEVQKKRALGIKRAWAEGRIGSDKWRRVRSVQMKQRRSTGDLSTDANRQRHSDMMKRLWAEGVFDDRQIDYGEVGRKATLAWSDERRRAASARSKQMWKSGAYDHVSSMVRQAWKDGKYDHIFNGNPTKPERLIMQILDEKGIEYKYQFNISGRLFDFQLAGYPILIEFDGAYWHSLPLAQHNDKYKNYLADKTNGVLFRIDGEQFNCKYKKKAMADAIQPAIDLRKEWLDRGVSFYQNSDEVWRIGSLKVFCGSAEQDTNYAIENLFAMYDKIKSNIDTRSRVNHA